MAAPAFTIDEYKAFTAGDNDESPPEAKVNIPYKTNIFWGKADFCAFFKVFLVQGVEYEIFFESNYTLDDFYESHVPLYHWKPSEWSSPVNLWAPNETYKDTNQEDGEPYSLPYDYKLNELVGSDWEGGRRYKLTPTETGFHVFGTIWT